ncbi:MAG: aminodeoxychorismate/anthranilate synthase component II [Propionibacteriaceae bacterium]|jgi:anthranilate synthase component 2|nr:aminodeoxychorismate/anthranilate synthase component II [Propionibacteriaceae bacterium]
MIVIIDNYDSFTYNLYQMIGQVSPDLQVIRNDALTVEELAALGASHIVLSPGPGHPRDAGICIETVEKLAGKTPILGVCLGHQAICEAYGATVSHAKTLMHGKSSPVTSVVEDPLFAGLPTVFQAARYHSLAADPTTMPGCLVVTATADDGEIMAVRHRDLPVFGVQFHPESVLTPLGRQILANFAGITV